MRRMFNPVVPTDKQLKTHHSEPGCAEGINLGEFTVSENGKTLSLNAVFRRDLRNLWGVPSDVMEVSFVEGIMVIRNKQQAFMCPGYSTRSFYFMKLSLF